MNVCAVNEECGKWTKNTSHQKKTWNVEKCVLEHGPLRLIWNCWRWIQWPCEAYIYAKYIWLMFRHYTGLGVINKVCTWGLYSTCLELLKWIQKNAWLNPVLDVNLMILTIWPIKSRCTQLVIFDKWRHQSLTRIIQNCRSHRLLQAATIFWSLFPGPGMWPQIWHYVNQSKFYSIPSRSLLRSAPGPDQAEQNPVNGHLYSSIFTEN